MVLSGLRYTRKLFCSGKRKKKDSAFGVKRLITQPLFSSSTLEDIPLWQNLSCFSNFSVATDINVNKSLFPRLVTSAVQ